MNRSATITGVILLVVSTALCPQPAFSAAGVAQSQPVAESRFAEQGLDPGALSKPVAPPAPEAVSNGRATALAASTLTVSFAALPAGGAAPLNVNFITDVGGTATGAVNYTFWWNCSDSGTNVNNVKRVCGDPSVAAVGMRVAATSELSMTADHVYEKGGNYAAKVIVERGAADPVTAFAVVGVRSCTQWCMTIQGTVRSALDKKIVVRGDGTSRRIVRLLTPTRNPTIYEGVVNADGTYSVLAPYDSYIARLEIGYTDHVSEGASSPQRELVIEKGPIRKDWVIENNFDIPPPVVVLQGLFSSAKRWSEGVDALTAAFGSDSSAKWLTRPIFTPTYSDVLPLEQGARDVEQELSDDFDLFYPPTPQYDVVAHSVGGLVARALASRPLGSRMRRAVLVGTPSSGSDCVGALWAAGDVGACPVYDFNSKYPVFPRPVLAIAGSDPGNTGCSGGTGLGDGYVGIGSAFNISRYADASKSSVVSEPLQGIVVPYSHIDLASAKAAWLFPAVILPFIESGSRPSACTSSLVAAMPSCTGALPGTADCVSGRGLMLRDGQMVCTVTAPATRPFGTALSWKTPASEYGTPTSLTLLPGYFAPCPSAAGDAAVGGEAAPTPRGRTYVIYASRTPIARVSDAMRIGVATTESFVDTTPTLGLTYYAVTSMVNGVESGPTIANVVVPPPQKPRSTRPR